MTFITLLFNMFNNKSFLCLFFISLINISHPLSFSPNMKKASPAYFVDYLTSPLYLFLSIFFSLLVTFLIIFLLLKIKSLKTALALKLATDDIKIKTKQQKLIKKMNDNNEKKFGLYVENSPVGIFIVNSKKQCLFLNKSAKILFDFSNDKLNEFDLHNLLLKNLTIPFENLFSNNDKLGFETFFTTDNGKTIYIILDLIKISKNQILGFCTDITNRKKSEESLLMLATAIEQASESIVISTKNGVIQYVNPAFEIITGYSKEEAIGEKTSRFSGYYENKDQFQNYIQTLKEGKNWKGIVKNHRKDGSEYLVENTISTVKDLNNIIIYYVAISSDVTQSMKMENQIKQMQKMEAIGQLAGGVAHDLNNVLTPILGYIDMYLLDTDENTELYDDLQEMKKASIKAKTMVQQLLAFSRKQILKMECISLIAVIKDLEKMLRRLIREDVDIKIEYPPCLNYMKGDTTQIQQIIINLCINAQDALPNGGFIHINVTNSEIGCELKLKHNEIIAGSYILLTISDNGLGMNKDTQNHLFEPFFTTKPIGKGTGLGLSTVFGIVKQHNGYIYVYSEEFIGSTFKIYFPICEYDNVEKNSLKLDLSSHDNEKIIIAEDDDAIKKFVIKSLTNNGFSVYDSASSLDCLEKINESDFKYDLLITDVIMPNLNGLDLFKQAKILQPDLKVLFMSGYDESVLMTDHLSEKCVNYLAKPFTVDTLLFMVIKALKN